MPSTDPRSQNHYTAALPLASCILARWARRWRRTAEVRACGGVLVARMRPANVAGSTRLYLSGESAAEVAALWEGSPPRAAFGLPTGFATAAADVYNRMAAFRGTTETSLANVIDALVTRSIGA